MNIPNVITSQSTNQIHPSEIPRTTNFYVASSPDPPSPRVILDAIRAGVGLGLGPRQRTYLCTQSVYVFVGSTTATSNHERSKEELYKQTFNDDTGGVESS